MDESADGKGVTHYTEVGAALGAAFGVAVGPLFVDGGMGLPIGLALGVMFGGVVGRMIEKARLANGSSELADSDGPT